MDDHPSRYEGSALLSRWRAAEPAERSQVKLAASLGVRQSAVSEWESGSRRPDFANALVLERLTGGAVPAESWGHDAATIERTAEALRDRAQRATDPAAVEVLHDANAAAVEGAA